MASDLDDDPPKLNDLHSFARHLFGPSSYEDKITPDTRQEIAAYLEGYAARLRFPVSLTPTDESMRAARRSAIFDQSSHLGLDVSRRCRASFATGWSAAGEALDLAVTSS